MFQSNWENYPSLCFPFRCWRSLLRSIDFRVERWYRICVDSRREIRRISIRVRASGKEVHSIWSRWSRRWLTPSHSTGSKYSISAIAHCSQIRLKISAGMTGQWTSERVSIDVPCRILNERHVRLRSPSKSSSLPFFLPNNGHDRSLFRLINGKLVRNNHRSCTFTETVPVEMFLQKKNSFSMKKKFFRSWIYIRFELLSIDQWFIVDLQSRQAIIDARSPTDMLRNGTFVTPLKFIARFHVGSWRRNCALMARVDRSIRWGRIDQTRMARAGDGIE